MIAIIDYDAGNIRSVEKALEYLGVKVKTTSKKEEILAADKVILPGVGAFKDAMNRLNNSHLTNTIYEVINKQTPFLGICLGLQLLFESSEENEGVKGLSILKGKVIKIPKKDGQKVPHMGWNSLQIKENARLFKGIKNDSYVYFVHSYYLQAEQEQEVAATTEYGVKIHASIEKDNIFACQFHPEKSGEVGLHILKNFAEL